MPVVALAIIAGTVSVVIAILDAAGIVNAPWHWILFPMFFINLYYILVMLRNYWAKPYLMKIYDEGIKDCQK